MLEYGRLRAEECAKLGDAGKHLANHWMRLPDGLMVTRAFVKRASKRG